jgi:uncharacterized DUF497 family protein
MEFEWDPAKAAINRRKHGISFAEASTVFADPNAVERFDPGNSGAEDRAVVTGVSARLRLLCVVYTERHGDTIRIISARRANQAEAARYAEAQG